VADIDEYLRFPKGSKGIKDFLQIQQAKNLTYLSFGKRMYTLDHHTNLEATNHMLDTNNQNPPFTLSQYPFFMKNFCYGNRKGAALCPSWMGRAKLIVHPGSHQEIAVHGTYAYLKLRKKDFGHHFNPELAHFMEWPHIFSPHNVTQRAGEDFTVAKESEVHIHNMENAFRKNTDGLYDVKYDPKLQHWFHAIINRARIPVNEANNEMK